MCPTPGDPNCTSLGPADEDKDLVGAFIAYDYLLWPPSPAHIDTK